MAAWRSSTDKIAGVVVPVLAAGDTTDGAVDEGCVVELDKGSLVGGCEILFVVLIVVGDCKVVFVPETLDELTGSIVGATVLVLLPSSDRSVVSNGFEEDKLSSSVSRSSFSNDTCPC